MTGAAQSRAPGRPVPFLIGWGLPLAILLSLNFARGLLPYEAIVPAIAATLAWMGAGCVTNAARCRRRHCYFSGPVFLLGAAAVLVAAFDVVPPGPSGLNYVVWATFGLVALTFVPEFIWGRYVPPPAN